MTPTWNLFLQFEIWKSMHINKFFLILDHLIKNIKCSKKLWSILLLLYIYLHVALTWLSNVYLACSNYSISQFKLGFVIWNRFPHHTYCYWLYFINDWKLGLFSFSSKMSQFMKIMWFRMYTIWHKFFSLHSGLLQSATK